MLRDRRSGTLAERIVTGETLRSKAQRGVDTHAERGAEQKVGKGSWLMEEGHGVEFGRTENRH